MGVLNRVHDKTATGIFSDDSMKQAYGLLSGVLPGGMGPPPTRGTAEFLRAYAQMPWLRAVTSRIATATARAEWQLFVVKGKNKPARRDIVIQRAGRQHRQSLLKQAAAKDELTQVTDHPLLDILHNANEFQTGYSMRKVTQLHMDLVGDALWLKERDAQNTVTAVWPIPPNWIMAMPTPSFRFFRVSYRAWRGIIPDTEFIWFSDPDPLNPYGRGTGQAMSLGDELETDEYAARMTKAFFYNQARPDLLVWPKGQGMTESNVHRMEEDWTSRNQGFWRSFKPYFLTREVEVKELDQNFRSLQFVQLREFERDTIMQNFGMPPEVLGVLTNSNRATIDAADFLMSRYLVEPRLEFQRMVMQERFVPEYDERLILEYVSPVQDDTEKQLEAAKAAPWSLSVDDWRRMAGRPPMDDEAAGALHMVPYTMTPQTLVEAPPQAGPAVVGVGADGQPIPSAPRALARALPLGLAQTVVSGTGGDLDLAAALDAKDQELAARLTKRLTRDGLPALTALATKYEPAMARGLLRAWRDHAARVSLPALEAALGQASVLGDILALLDSAGLGASQTATLEPLLVRVALRGAEFSAQGLRRLGIPVRSSATVSAEKPGGLAVNLAKVHPRASQWAKARAAALVQASAEVLAQIAALIARANDEGITPQRTARLLRDTVGLTDRQEEAVEHFRARLATEGVDATALERRVARYAAAQQRARAETIARTECLPAEAFVDGAVVGAALRRWYVGQMVEIVTRQGRKFSATPNHPMLTRRGWVAAGQLQQGDDLICDGRQQDFGAPRNQDVATGPAPVGEIFCSLQNVSVLEQRFGRSDDFHGDGRESKIDILRPHRLLPIGRFAPIYQPLAQDIFAKSDEARSAYCLACGRLLSIDQQPCLCDGTSLDSSLPQAKIDNAGTDAERVAEALHAFAGSITSGDLVERQGILKRPMLTAALIEAPPRVAQRAYLDAALMQLTGNPFAVSAQLRRYEIDAQPALVEFDRVQNIRIRTWSGHVFNLSTAHGYYTLNGVYTGNTMSSLNHGQQMLWDEAVAQEVIQADQFDKEWIATEDDLLCPICEDLDGETVGIDEDFSDGEETPPDHTDCRCSCGLVPVEEKAQRVRQLQQITPSVIHVQTPAPIVNVSSAAPVVNITMPDQPAPVVHVAAPHVTVLPAQVAVAPPDVKVNVVNTPPAQAKRTHTKRVERDGDGLVTRIIEE